jgi:AcrR family transcriptional regulator
LRRDGAKAKLLSVARAEFLRYGFDGTDVSRIARKAGVAPNTFYRYFKGKVDVFIAVYLTWAVEENRAFEQLIAKRGTVAEIVQAVILRHRQHVWFRRSVRRLAHDDTFVRRAVALARHDILATLAAWAGAAADPSALAADLIQYEQLAVALAEAELGDLAIDDSALRGRMADMLMRWRIRAIQGPAARA